MSDQSENPREGKRSIRSLFEKFAAAIAPEPDSQSDLLDVIHDAHSRKLIDAECLSMIEGVFKVYQSAARDIMIPRTRMLTVDISQPIEIWIADVIKFGHSRYPAIDGDPDKVVGILFAKDLVKHYESSLSIKDTLRPAVFIPESKRLNVLLRDFKNTRNHMAIVIDEFGSVSGLVTIEDVLEEIVGEIVDEYEDINSENRIVTIQRDDGSKIWRLPAWTEMELFNETLGVNLEDNRVETIGGFITSHLGYMPHVGETFDLDNLHFEIIRADAQKILTVSVYRTVADNR